MRGRDSVGRPFDPDLLSNEYGFRCPRVAVSNSFEARRDGTESPLAILEAIPRIFLVIIVSPRRNMRATLNNYVGILIVIFWSHLETLKEIIK